MKVGIFHDNEMKYFKNVCVLTVGLTDMLYPKQLKAKMGNGPIAIFRHLLLLGEGYLRS